VQPVNADQVPCFLIPRALGMKWPTVASPCCRLRLEPHGLVTAMAELSWMIWFLGYLSMQYNLRDYVVLNETMWYSWVEQWSDGNMLVYFWVLA
jgi:hypothetical protein